MLYRKIASLIEAHLQSDSNKILLIDGARQVGKTYIVRYVGQKLFENYIEINLVEDALGAGLFANVRTVEDFYLQVSSQTPFSPASTAAPATRMRSLAAA